MNYEVRLTTEAENDLRGIFEYIAFELQSPQNAAGQLDRLEQSIMSLDQMPERFRVYEKNRGTAVISVSCRWITISCSTYRTTRSRLSRSCV